jgi:CRISPR-associated protein Cas2
VTASTLVVMVYDVADDKRRRRLNLLLQQYGVAVQESAFEGRLTRRERERLLARVAQVLDAAADRFSLYPIPRSHEREVVSVGLPRPELPDTWFYIV